MIVSIWRNLWCLSAGKKSTLHFTFSLRYCKDTVNLLLWVFTPKVILSTCRKLLCLSAGEKSTSSPMLFWIYCKDMQISYFGYFRHAWFLHTQNDRIVGIKGLRFVNHESISWFHWPNICKISIFHKLFFFKIYFQNKQHRWYLYV